MGEDCQVKHASLPVKPLCLGRGRTHNKVMNVSEDNIVNVVGTRNFGTEVTHGTRIISNTAK